MIKNTYLRKTTRDEVTNCYDSQNYVHVYKCPTCDCSVIRSLLNFSVIQGLKKSMLSEKTFYQISF